MSTNGPLGVFRFWNPERDEWVEVQGAEGPPGAVAVYEQASMPLGAEEGSVWITDAPPPTQVGPTGPTGPQGPMGDGGIRVPIEPWRVVGAAGQPPFQNGWAAFGSGYALPSFRKWPDGTVSLRGMMVPGTVNQPAFTLPPGYRPTEREVWVRTQTGSPPWGSVFPNGEVVQHLSPGTWVTLDGITFDTETVTEWTTGPPGPIGPPTIFDVQRNLGTAATTGVVAFAAPVGAWGNINRGDGATLQLGITPSVACWWEANLAVYLTKTDAAYHSVNVGFLLSPADQDGAMEGRGVVASMHSTVVASTMLYANRMFRLAAGTTYSLTARTSISGGTWQYIPHRDFLWLEGKAWPQ
jgi:hypothetical protein